MPAPQAEHTLEYNPFDLSLLPGQVRACLAEFFSTQQPLAKTMGQPLPQLFELLQSYVLEGGKRIRPMFAWVGFGAGGGFAQANTNLSAVLRAVSSLELIQACALIHDDFIDSSDTRRGKPTIHKVIEKEHAEQSWLGDSGHFGASVSVLVGDLALVWADDMFHGCGLAAPALARATEPWAHMRTEVISGQLLDIYNEVGGSNSIDRAMRVNELKTASYTIERPLHLGAALAGADADIIAGLRHFGQKVGVAFQLRDDLLGVFGDSSLTGKPTGDDLREGKRTVLTALALEHADPEQAAFIEAGIGNVHTPAEIAALSTAIRDTGVEARIEDMIISLTKEGIHALDSLSLPAPAYEALLSLATKATARRV